MNEYIGFNRPYLTGKEYGYIENAVESLHLSGNGSFTKKCQTYFEERYGFSRCLLTSSCTDALEMAAILCNVGPGDEVIMPSYTFVSTANAFVLRGAKIVFCDSRTDHPGMDEDQLEALITPCTKVIVPVHYAGVACDMDKIMALAEKHGVFVVEDAAQAIDSFYTDGRGVQRPLGSIGHLAAFSFHETKNIISGEGGMLVINHPEFEKRAEVIWEKGTNRSAFFRGEVDKYGWMDMGSSFLPSEMVAAFLWAQLESLDDIQSRRKAIWTAYYDALSLHPVLKNYLPQRPEWTTNNAHMFYLVLSSLEQRSDLIAFLKTKNIQAVFHYQSLHASPFHLQREEPVSLPNCERYSDCLVRLPFFYTMDQGRVIEALNQWKG